VKIQGNVEGASTAGLSSANWGGLRRAARSLFVVGFAVVALCAFAGAAQAASPAWKLLATTGPTYLPPKQSEVQRLTVEAEGGTFALSPQTAKGEGTLKADLTGVAVTEGSDEGELKFGTPEVGLTVITVGTQAFPAGTTVTAVAGTTVTFSNPSERGGVAFFKLASKEVTGVSTSTGAFRVGDGISGEGIPTGTTVTAVGSETLTLSQAPSSGGTVELRGSETTAPIPYNAAASTLQSALEALPVFTAGMFSVSGGPGGDTEHPYFVNFGGPLAEQDVPALGVETGGLVGEHAAVHLFTMVPGGPGTGEIVVDPANIGGASTSGEYTMTLGPLPAGVVTAGSAHGEKWECPGGAGESTVTCTSTDAVARLSPASSVRIPIEVEPSVAASDSAPITIAGAGGGSANYQMPIVISTQRPPVATSAFWAGSFDENGETEVQAGGHPYSAISYFMINTVRSVNGRINPVGDSKSVVVDLPPGFAGNPMVTARCPQSQVVKPDIGDLGSPVCNDEMKLGTFQASLLQFGETSSQFTSAFLNDVPAQGYAAEFTTKIVFPLQGLLASVRSSGDFGIRITAPNNPNYDKIYGAFAALEGFPAGAHGKAFFRNATDCAEMTREAPVVLSKFDTWQQPGVFSENAGQVLPALTNCGPLTESWVGNGPESQNEKPTLSFQPTSSAGSSPVGADVHLHIPQGAATDPTKLGPSDLKKTVVTLPQGLALNPSQANGAQTCSEAQIGYEGPGALPNPTRFNEASPTCPDGSKLGTAEIKSPLLESPLKGTVYLAAQEENPFHSLIALYLVVDDARTGIVLKFPGEVQLDPSTGQVTAVFDHSPQLPFEDLELHLRGGGPRAELATPEVCGHYASTGSLTPWSAMTEAASEAAQIEEAGFDVSSGCASSPGARPFSPSFVAGTEGGSAGSYSPLVVKVARKDGEQELTNLDFTLPKGLIGKLAGIPYCSDAAIAAAQGKTGKAEQANPSCPAASRIGSVDTAAGVGSEPVHVGGNVYLAGPYKGAPVSAVVVTPGIAGPFDLGNVVIRSPLYVDPETTQLTTKSDPIPTILRGIPLKVRSVTVSIDRPGFILNPTSCEPMMASASLTGGSGAIATPSNRFQGGGCSTLKFSPKLNLSAKGSTRRNGNPALTAVLTQPAAQANIAKVAVTLPHSEFLDQSHIRTVCTRVQFAAQACPSGSIYGEAEAFTPLLDQPLKGPVYLRSSSNKLPDLVVALKGPASQPIEVNLAGRIDSVKGGIRNSFELVPDAPVTKFVLKMQGGKKGLLVNSTNICRRTNKATVKMEGQNGKVSNFSSPLKAQCGGKKPNNSKKQSKKSDRRSPLSKLSAIW
jgi:hypothetical protein